MLFVLNCDKSYYCPEPWCSLVVSCCNTVTKCLKSQLRTKMKGWQTNILNQIPEFRCNTVWALSLRLEMSFRHWVLEPAAFSRSSRWLLEKGWACWPLCPGQIPHLEISLRTHSLGPSTAENGCSNGRPPWENISNDLIATRVCTVLEMRRITPTEMSWACETNIVFSESCVLLFTWFYDLDWNNMQSNRCLLI